MIGSGVRHRWRVHYYDLCGNGDTVGSAANRAIVDGEGRCVDTVDIGCEGRTNRIRVRERRPAARSGQRPAVGQRIAVGIGGATAIECHRVTHVDRLVRTGISHRRSIDRTVRIGGVSIAITVIVEADGVRRELLFRAVARVEPGPIEGQEIE